MESELFQESKKYFHPASPFPNGGKQPTGNISAEERLLADTPESLRKPKGSFRLVTWVTLHSSLRGSSKIIAAFIASHYNSKTHRITPSMDRIVDKTRYNKKTVDKAINEMVESGEWKIEKKYNQFTGFSYHLYTPVAPKSDAQNDGMSWISHLQTPVYKEKLENEKLYRKSQGEKMKNRLEAQNVTTLRNIKKIEEPNNDS